MTQHNLLRQYAQKVSHLPSTQTSASLLLSSAVDHIAAGNQIALGGESVLQNSEDCHDGGCATGGSSSSPSAGSSCANSSQRIADKSGEAKQSSCGTSSSDGHSVGEQPANFSGAGCSSWDHVGKATLPDTAQHDNCLPEKDSGPGGEPGAPKAEHNRAFESGSVEEDNEVGPDRSSPRKEPIVSGETRRQSSSSGVHDAKRLPEEECNSEEEENGGGGGGGGTDSSISSCGDDSSQLSSTDSQCGGPEAEAVNVMAAAIGSEDSQEGKEEEEGEEGGGGEAGSAMAELCVGTLVGTMPA